jgi:hypothetical protein
MREIDSTELAASLKDLMVVFNDDIMPFAETVIT